MDRKDVGILAMDIYFPPSCVQQVKLFSQLLTVRVTISVLLLRPTPLRGDSDASVNVDEGCTIPWRLHGRNHPPTPSWTLLLLPGSVHEARLAMRA